jgi:hypothetical protein
LAARGLRKKHAKKLPGTFDFYTFVKSVDIDEKFRNKFINVALCAIILADQQLVIEEGPPPPIVATISASWYRQECFSPGALARSRLEGSIYKAIKDWQAI